MATHCRYLSKDHLRGFSTYKYSSIENSPLTKYVLIPWWNTVVKICPLWLAPNLITLSGFLILLSIFFLLWYFDPVYTTTSNDLGIIRPPIPSWVWIYAGIAQFTAHTLDGIDGKQARRTGTSSPLGELFDHGLDSFGCILLPLSMYSAVGSGHLYSGPPLECYLFASTLMLGFYISHWEKYITGTLYMPWALDIGEVGGALFYIVTGIFGVKTWQFHVFGFSCAIIFRNAIYFGFAVTVIVSIYNVLQFIGNGSTSITTPPSSPSSSPPCSNAITLSKLVPGIPVLLLFGFSTVWCLYSPNNVIVKAPRIFVVAVGLVFSNISCKLIIAQMSSQPTEPFNFLLVPFITAVCTSFVLPQYELMSLYALTVVALATHLHFGISIVFELSSFFNIRVFLISKPNPNPTSPKVQSND